MSAQATTYTLKHPITVDGETYVTLTVYEPNVAVLEVIDEIGFVEGKRVGIKQVRLILSAVTRVSNKVIGEMHRDDFEALVELAVPFLQAQEAHSVQ